MTSAPDWHRGCTWCWRTIWHTTTQRQTTSMTSMTQYNILFLALDPTMPWSCAAPKHKLNIPPATLLVFITLMPQPPLIVHQAMYACDECANEMKESING